jgi:hypothetical protein
MQQSRNWRVSFLTVATLIAVCVTAPDGFAQTPSAGTQAPAAPAAPAPQAPSSVPPAPPNPDFQAFPFPPQSVTEAELKRINDLIAQQGRDIAITPIITEILGITRDNQTLTCHAFAAVGDGNEVHQIYLLPDGKGYLAAHFYKDKLDVYSVDKNFALVAALEGIRGQAPAPTTFADAQYGYHFEQTWWAKYADTH